MRLDNFTVMEVHIVVYYVGTNVLVVLPSSTKAVCSFKMQPTCQTALCHNLEDHICTMGACGNVTVKALGYKREGCGFKT
jgi:hypothetical protein